MKTIFINDVEFELVPMQEYQPKSSEWPTYYMKADESVDWMAEATTYALRPLVKETLNNPREQSNEN